MTLNKDLFGKIPVTAVTTTPVHFTIPRVKGFGGKTVFHGSVKEPDEFMKAPTIHVGTAEQAAHTVDNEWNEHWNSEFDEPEYLYAEDVPGVHEFQLSKNAKIHPVTVPDDIANEANAHFLRERGYRVPMSVSSSRSFHGENHPLVKTALKALRQNKIVPYVNTWETPKWLYEGADMGDPDLAHGLRESEKSYIVPSPSLNMAQFGRKDPSPHPRLPMDYTGVLPESKLTKQYKKAVDLENEWQEDQHFHHQWEENQPER